MPQGWKALVDTAPYLEGTFHICTPEEALEWAWAGAAAVGVSHVTDVTNLTDPPIPVVQSLRPHSAGDLRTMGKSPTHDGAVIGALMEAVERASAELPHDDPRQIRPNGRSAIPTVDTDLLERPPGGGLPMDGTEPWIVADIINGDGQRLVPFELVSTNWRPPTPGWAGRVRGSSNGLAAGFTPTTATLQGLCEVIERDAVTMWELAGLEHQARTRIALSTVKDQTCTDLIRAFLGSGLRVGLWNLTSEIGVTVIQAAVIAKDPARVPGPGGGEPMVGLGCHPDPSAAIVRALTEAAQTRVSMVFGLDELPAEDYRRAADFAPTAHALIDCPASVSVADLPCHTRSAPFEELAVIADLVSAQTGQPVLAVDLTGHDSPPVVKVIAPGLESNIRIPGWNPGPRARAALDEDEVASPDHHHHDHGTPTRHRTHPQGRPVAFVHADRFPDGSLAKWSGIDIRPAATAGDVLQAATDGATAIALIDIDPVARPRSGTLEASAALRLGVPLVTGVGAGALIGLDLVRFGARCVGSTADRLRPLNVVDESELTRTKMTMDLPTILTAVELCHESGLLDRAYIDALCTAARALRWDRRRWDILLQGVPDTTRDAVRPMLATAITKLYEIDVVPVLTLTESLRDVVSTLPPPSTNSDALLTKILQPETSQ